MIRLPPRGNRKKSFLKHKKLAAAIQQYAYEYKPRNIISTRNSLLWRWRRVYEWHLYINDPIENTKGHMIT